MNLPWLKSLLFWIILIIVIVLIFQCSQKSEANKTASTLMYEKLSQCTGELKNSQHATLIQHIQNSVQAQMKQADLMQLLTQCRKANPVKSKLDYINAIKSLK